MSKDAATAFLSQSPENQDSIIAMSKETTQDLSGTDLRAIIEEKTPKKRKGGPVHKNKRPQMMHGGVHKGKKHAYAAGGVVKDMKIMRSK